MKSFNIKVASQAKQRKVAKAWTGDDIQVEDAPFRFQLRDKKGHYEVKEAPWGYVIDVPSHVLGYLDSLDE